MASNKYEDWVQARFQGLTKDELLEAGKIFGCEFDRGADVAVMRTKLCEKTGAAPFKEPAPAPRASGKMGKKPNLTPQGVWEGRRRRVIISRQAHEINHKAKALIWEGVTRLFAYDEVIDMPDPWFNVMASAVSAHLSQKKVKDEEGNLDAMELIETPYNVHLFRDLGVTPGTEDLPGDLSEYWAKEAKRTNYFAGTSRSALIAMRGDFVGSVGIQAYKDLTTEEIRFDVLRRCNLEGAIMELEAQAEERHAASQAA